MKTITLKISDMHCGSCAMNVDFELEDLKGVKEAKTSFVKQTSLVTFDENKVALEDMVAVINKLGYKVVVANKNGV